MSHPTPRLLRSVDRVASGDLRRPRNDRQGDVRLLLWPSLHVIARSLVSRSSPQRVACGDPEQSEGDVAISGWGAVPIAWGKRDATHPAFHLPLPDFHWSWWPDRFREGKDSFMPQCPTRPRDYFGRLRRPRNDRQGDVRPYMLFRNFGFGVLGIRSYSCTLSPCCPNRSVSC